MTAAEHAAKVRSWLESGRDNEISDYETQHRSAEVIAAEWQPAFDSLAALEAQAARAEKLRDSLDSVMDERDGLRAELNRVDADVRNHVKLEDAIEAERDAALARLPARRRGSARRLSLDAGQAKGEAVTPAEHAAQPAWSRGLDRCDNADGFENVWLPAEEALALAAEVRRLGALDNEHYPERLEHALAALEAQAARAEEEHELNRKLLFEDEREWVGEINKALNARFTEVVAERDAALAQRTDYHDAMMAEQAKRIVVEAQLEAARKALRPFRVFVETFEGWSWNGTTTDGLNRLTDREWLNLRERLTECIRVAALAAVGEPREEVSEPEVGGGHASAVTMDVGASAHGDPPASSSIRRGPTSLKKDPGASGSLTSPVGEPPWERCKAQVEGERCLLNDGHPGPHRWEVVMER